ncbi:MAG: hypothetical protein ACLFP1_02520 [Candidatus Goldiibacteriota bacterium]
MKQIVLLLGSIIFLFTGCGQDVQLTVYNSTNVTSANGWVWLQMASDSIEQRHAATDNADTVEQLNESNSFTVKIKENEIVNVHIEGGVYTRDSEGTVTGSDEFEADSSPFTVFGGFPDAPRWFASANKESVIVFRR